MTTPAPTTPRRAGAAPTRISVVQGHGISAQLPPGWEGRIFLRNGPTGEPYRPQVLGLAAGAGSRGGQGWAGELVTPVLHLGNFALPAERGDYGGAALDVMNSRQAFAALVTFGEAERGTALYAAQGMPRPRLRDFDPDALQRKRPNQLGYQRFFSISETPVALYIVLGTLRAARSLDEINELLKGIRVV
jgi:hypothetical protein